jgi:EmrB/QacA subfamily drug resistance transporter
MPTDTQQTDLTTHQTDGPPTRSGPVAALVGHPVRTFVITSVAMFMVQLDNLVVTTALPSIQRSLHAGLQGLQWTVSAYTLTFAVFLLTGATLGDRFGRKRLFLAGLSLFTAASLASALSPNIEFLIAARAVQGFGGAIVLPLTLTMLSAAVKPERRGAVIGAWGGVAGLAVALGPVIGGAVVEEFSWKWIFWINVPIGVVLVPVAWFLLSESRGPARRLDLVGNALICLGLFGVVLGLIRGGDIGWTSPEILAGFVAGGALIAAFVVWEARSDHPMLPLKLFRTRAFPLINLSAMLMSFGMFGSIFFLAQFLQTVQGYSPLASGLRVLPWTAMPMVVAPIAGIVSDRIGGRPVVGVGLALQAAGLAWIALVTTTTVSYAQLVGAFIISGIGMAMFFAPIANLVLGAVRREQEGLASGVNNAIRELGGVLGIAVMGAIFAAAGGYGPTAKLGAGQHFVNGLIPATYVGAAVVAVASLSMWLVPRARKAGAAQAQEEGGEPAPESTHELSAELETLMEPVG